MGPTAAESLSVNSWYCNINFRENEIEINLVWTRLIGLRIHSSPAYGAYRIIVVNIN